jgi:hypothetical protein
MRNKDSKWYISPEDFKDDYFGSYCSGSAYLMTPDLPAQLFNASLYTKFFWVDDYYMTGLLVSAVNATYQFFNSLYIINSNLVEQRFTGKESEYTVFGHLPGQLNKIYNLWSIILNNQIVRFPNLKKARASIVEENDFAYLDLFQWTRNIWDKYLITDEVSMTDLESID